MVKSKDRGELYSATYQFYDFIKVFLTSLGLVFLIHEGVTLPALTGSSNYFETQMNVLKTLKFTESCKKVK